MEEQLGRLRGFSAMAMEAVFHGQMEAARSRQSVISPEHLLLGLLRASGAIALRVLTELGADPAQIRAEVERRAPRGDGVPDVEELMKCRLTPEAELVLTDARSEAEESRSPHVGTTHLLLGLLRREQSLAGEVLRALGITPERVRLMISDRPEG